MRLDREELDQIKDFVQFTFALKPYRHSEILNPDNRRLSKKEIMETISEDGTKIMCLEDGAWVCQLRRHLKRFGVTFEMYKARWGLPYDYPYCAPALSEIHKNKLLKWRLIRKSHAK